MLKNKYFALILVTIAIVLVANTIIKMTKPKKEILVSHKMVPPVPEPTVESPVSILKLKNKEKSAKTKRGKLSSNKKTEESSFSPYLPLEENEPSIIAPETLIWGEDPFGSNNKITLNKIQDEKFKQFSLEAIIIRENKKYAIINNTVFKEGDYKRGILLKKINVDNIIIISEKEEIILTIFKKKTIKLSDKKKGSK